MQTKIKWTDTLFISAISCIASFIFFLLLQIIGGDLLRELNVHNQVGYYFNITLILYIGLLLVFGASFLTNLIVFKRDYHTKGLFYANLLSLGFTILILYFVSWISIVIVYWESYSKLTLIQEIRLIPYFYVYFAIYILQNAVFFWYIALICYHLLLIIFIKAFYKKKIISKKKTRIAEKPLYSNPLTIRSNKQWEK